MRGAMAKEILPTDIVQRQLDAYNARDIEAFLDVFSDTAEAGDLGAKTPAIVGKEQLRQRYGDLFARSPNLHSALVSRTALANVVVDHERITGRDGSAEPYEVLAINEVRDGLIHRVFFVRNQ